MTTPERNVEEIVEEALDLLHECIQHTPIKLSQTNGTEYDKGYIFYQDMVVRDVLDNTPKLKALFNEALQTERQRCEEIVKAIEKAFGGCKKCYGKGYSTVLDSTTYHADFIGDKTYSKQNNPMRFCSCDRGKQLKTLTQPNNPK